jgi:hypothetical protein
MHWTPLLHRNGVPVEAQTAAAAAAAAAVVAVAVAIAIAAVFRGCTLTVAPAVKTQHTW